MPISCEVDGRSHGGEGGPNLDTQYTEDLAYPVPSTCYYSNSRGSAGVSPSRGPGPHYWTGTLGGRPRGRPIERPTDGQLGVRYSNVPPEYATSLRDLFGALETSVLAASGDLGVNARDCKDDSGSV